MNRYRAIACVALVAGLLLTYFVWATEVDPESRWRFKLGLDLAGGTELIYRADMSQTASEEQDDALTALRDVIGRRVNLFGVAEPIVQTQEASTALGTTEDRLIVDLPGVTDIQAAVDALGETPVLEFKLVRVVDDETAEYSATGLTGRYLEKASLQFASGVSAALAEPQVLLSCDSAGAELFEKITSEHVGEMLAIFLDGVPISTPVIQEAIPGGQATVSGNFTATQARDLVRNLNFGALPVPIILESSSAIGPSLGAAAIDAGVLAGLVGFALIALFMILWYRLPGFIAVVALVEYLAFMLVVIKVVPVTLTAPGIAGLIITLGMAVDANVLISERMKEELKKGEGAREAVRVGFARAWSAIRDGHLPMLISDLLLFWLGTSFVQCFPLALVLCVLASLISAVTLSRVFLLAIVPEMREGAWRFLMGSGFRKQN